LRGYGADPVPTLDLLLSLPNLLVIRGNHDEALFRDGVIDVPGIRETLDWTSEQLTPAHRRLLGDAPYVRTLGDATYAHASAHNPQQWEYLRQPEQIKDCLAAAGTRVTFIGHVHVPMVYYCTAAGTLRELNPEPGVPVPLSATCHYVINVGSVGQPRDGNNASGYVLYDSDAGTVTFFAAVRFMSAGENTRRGLDPVCRASRRRRLSIAASRRPPFESARGHSPGCPRSLHSRRFAPRRHVGHYTVGTARARPPF
jgi:diadenosine tetraphosphatase ApaH/serine/threonine PP2A family protein phosphatase